MWCVSPVHIENVSNGLYISSLDIPDDDRSDEDRSLTVIINDVFSISLSTTCDKKQ